MRSRNRTGLALAAIAALALAIVAVGCGGGDDNNSTSAGGGGGGVYGGGGGGTTSTTASTGGGVGVVSVADNPKLGKILVDSKGNTLYYFLKDKQGGTSSTCSGACAGVWPPYTTSGAPKGQNGAQASKLGTIKRSDGTTEVTYNGWPLYTYTGDSKPGDTNGNDFEQFGAEWYAITPAGTKPKD
jgi:predicted lipoprotein with Yx(FWY)xxD motif